MISVIAALLLHGDHAAGEPASITSGFVLGALGIAETALMPALGLALLRRPVRTSGRA